MRAIESDSIAWRLLSAAALFVALALFAEPAFARKPIDETIKLGGGFPVVNATIPVDDHRTKSIPGALYEPKGSGPFPAVILAHGCNGLAFNAGALRLAVAGYVQHGVAALVIDSLSPRGLSEDCMSIYWGYRVKDAYAALGWLGARPEIDSKHIFLQGYSTAGASSTMAAVNPHETTVAPHKDRFAGAIVYYPWCRTSDKFSVPTIIFVGQADDYTPAKQCVEITDKANLEVVVYPHARHGFANPGERTVRGVRMAYDEKAAADAQRRALRLIESLRK